jgi:hypothetical protein
MELINKTTHEFTDISSEEYRTYEFAEGSTTINEPISLSVSENGHRVLDASGKSHYIPKTWLRLEWKAKAGQPHFVR